MIIHQSPPEGQQYTSGIDENREATKQARYQPASQEGLMAFRATCLLKREREKSNVLKKNEIVVLPASYSWWISSAQGNKTSINVWGKGYFVFCMSTSHHTPAFSSLVIPAAISHCVATVSSLLLYWGIQSHNSNCLWPNSAKGVSSYMHRSSITRGQCAHQYTPIPLAYLWLRAYPSFYYVLI